MDIDDLKSDWNTVQPIVKKEEELLLMLQENKHPVLKSIRKQIWIEVTAWLVFLLVYYSMFDGAKKPFFVHLILIIALLLPVIHSIYGYHYNKYLANGSNVKEALEQLYNRLQNYALISVISRTGFVFGFLFYFIYNINFTPRKLYLFVLIGIVFLIQLFVLFRIWNTRLKDLRKSIYAFTVGI